MADGALPELFATTAWGGRKIAAKPTAKIYIMTPIDVTFNAPALPAGDNIVKDVMLPAAKAVAQAHNIPIIDTYTQVPMSYYAVDGQVNAAGQMKMATMILEVYYRHMPIYGKAAAKEDFPL